MSSVHGDNTENSIFKLYMRNFINISSSNNLLDAIFTEISSTMFKITVWIGKSSSQCDMLRFGKTDNCTPNLSDSGLVVKTFAFESEGCRFESPHGLHFLQ